MCNLLAKLNFKYTMLNLLNNQHILTTSKVVYKF